MTRFLLPAGASIAAGLMLGAAAVFGVTLVAQGQPQPPSHRFGQQVGADQVQYGDRCDDDDDDDDDCLSANHFRQGAGILP